MKKALILTVAVLALTSSHAFALTNEQVPVDSKGVALIDPDQKFDDMPLANSGNGSTTSKFDFGGVTFSIAGNIGNQPADVPRPATVQTGSQLYNSMMIPAQRWH